VITLKSHAHGRKPETTIEGNVRGYAIAKRGVCPLRKQDGAHCVSCVRLTQGHYCLG